MLIWKKTAKRDRKKDLNRKPPADACRGMNWILKRIQRQRAKMDNHFSFLFIIALTLQSRYPMLRFLQIGNLGESLCLGISKRGCFSDDDQ